MEIVKDIYTNSTGNLEMVFKKDGQLLHWSCNTTRDNIIKLAEEYFKTLP